MERSFLFLFLCLSCGALDAEANEMKTVSVMEGDFNTHSLTTPKIVRKYQPCSPERSARSKCVLECSARNAPDATLTWYNGSSVFSIIKISNLNIDPSLCLEVEYQDKNTYNCVLSNLISSRTKHLNINELCQSCSPTTHTQVSVKEGDSVTLHSNFTNIQLKDQILWMFGPREFLIAEILKTHVYIFGYDDNGRLIDRLQLDSQTGDLTITNTSKEISGVYKLQINNESSTCWSFNVTVCEPLPSPHISNHSTHCPSSGSECVLECSVENVTNVNLSWYEGNSLLSNIIVSDVNYLCLNLDYKDNGNYSCVVSNSFINETKNLIISELCSEQNNNHIVEICLGALALVIVIVSVGVGFCLHKHRQTSQKDAGCQTATSQNSPPEASNNATDSNTGNEQQPLIDRLPLQSIPLCCTHLQSTHQDL
ncbi:opioid-binding protein/cell adhesion molecule homolog [Megalobrama amblycephala]|uniref:opioid-binding protein/cell adhesion molecule homolog n=1 Tax=Megalobrama amblycephala TaxID=75352 RepID=UPI002013F541|nr:opioid-binding protein/cell adhesion molecule homolog [Megalobrama amblycephala]